MPVLQKQDPELAEINNYLGTGDLPISDKSARKIVMIADQFALDDNVLWHFYSSVSRHTKKKLIPTKQLCIQLSLKLDILKLYNEQGSSHKNPEALFETIRQKYLWFNLYSDTQLYCNTATGVSWPRREHTQIRLRYTAWSLVSFGIRFWRTSQVRLRQIL